MLRRYCLAAPESGAIVGKSSGHPLIPRGAPAPISASVGSRGLSHGNPSAADVTCVQTADESINAAIIAAVVQYADACLIVNSIACADGVRAGFRTRFRRRRRRVCARRSRFRRTIRMPIVPPPALRNLRSCMHSASIHRCQKFEV